MKLFQNFSIFHNFENFSTIKYNFGPFINLLGSNFNIFCRYCGNFFVQILTNQTSN